MPKQKRLTGVPIFLGSLLLLGLVGSYVWTTIVLFNRAHTTETANSMLSMKVDMLETEVATVDLSMVATAQTTLLESGTCVMDDDFGPPAQGLINYNYYSYTIANLTRYFVEFDGGISGIPGGAQTSAAGCPGGARTGRYRINIFGCLTDPGRDSGVPSLINQGFPGQNERVHQSFTATDFAKIDFGGATDTVITNIGSASGPCTPNLYTVTSGGDLTVLTTGLQYETLTITWWAWTTAAPPFSTTLNNVRVPIPQSFTISK